MSAALARAAGRLQSPRTARNLDGLHYGRLDVSDARRRRSLRTGLLTGSISWCWRKAPWSTSRGEFEMPGFRKVLEVNLDEPDGLRRQVPSHAQSEPVAALIIVCSTAAYHSTKGNPAYNASKTGAMGLTRTLGEAWAEDGIRVNGIAPGLVDTKMTKVTTANPKRLGGRGGKNPAEAAGHAGGHGRCRAIPGIAARVLHRRADADCGWWTYFVSGMTNAVSREAVPRLRRDD